MSVTPPFSLVHEWEGTGVIMWADLHHRFTQSSLVGSRNTLSLPFRIAFSLREKMQPKKRAQMSMKMREFPKEKN
jgi:hypothetical protein